MRNYVLLRDLRPRHVAELGDLAHLIDVDAKVGTGADQAIGVGRREAVLRDQPVHQVDGGGVDGRLERPIGEDGDNRIRLVDPHPRHTLLLDDVELQADRGVGFGGGAGVFGVALAGVDVAQVEPATLMIDRQVDAMAGADVADVQVAAPVALAVQAGRDFSIRRHADRANERRDRPG